MDDVQLLKNQVAALNREQKFLKERFQALLKSQNELENALMKTSEENRALKAEIDDLYNKYELIMEG